MALTTPDERRETVRVSARAHALDWYLSALLAPRDRRDDLVTLAAYLGEIARVPFIVSEPGLGLVRLAWWRETILAGADSGNPVADGLLDVARRRGLANDLLLAPLDGRARELEEAGFASEAARAAYFAETAGAPFRLAVSVLGVAAAPVIDRLCAAAGEAWGTMQLARDLPRHMARANPTVAYLSQIPGAAEPHDAARDALRTENRRLAIDARDALAEARALQAKIPSDARPAFLPLALVEPYLRALQDRNRDPLAELVEISPLARVSRLWLAAWRGKF